MMPWSKFVEYGIGLIDPEHYEEILERRVKEKERNIIRLRVQKEVNEMKLASQRAFDKWLKPTAFYPEPIIIDVEYEDV